MWVQKLMERHSDKRHVLMIRRVRLDSSLTGVLLPGDLLVGIEGAAVVTFRDVDNAIRGKATVKVSLIRDGVEKEIEVKVSALGSMEQTGSWNGQEWSCSRPSISWQQ